MDACGTIDVIRTAGVGTQVMCAGYTHTLEAILYRVKNHVTVMLANGFAEYPSA